MKRMAWRLIRMAACMSAVWLVAAVVYRFLPLQDEVAAMLLLVSVLATATLADRTLAVATSLSAGVSFSYYFIGPAQSFSFTSEDAVSFAAFIIAALTGSHLSIRAQLRAGESEQRRREMERLQQLGASLVAADTVTEAAEKATREIANLFGGGVILRVDGLADPFVAGTGTELAPVVVHQVSRNGVLELYGMQPSMEVQNALVQLISLVLDKAAAAEERTRMIASQKGEELRTTVLNALAHNFRTPLTSIKAAASMMRGSQGEPGCYSQELMEIIDEEADRLDDLIRDSLDLARLQARQAEPRQEVCSVAALVSSVLRKLKRHLAGRTVLVDLPEDLPAVTGDSFLFEQMLTQVLDNAWKYSGAGARIWIWARHSGEEIVLSIRNEGAAIPDAERTLLFDRFYRGNQSRASMEGTGLGLSIAKTIAEAHGGRVWLESEPEGPAFRFALPARAFEENHDREPHYIAD